MMHPTIHSRHQSSRLFHLTRSKSDGLIRRRIIIERLSTTLFFPANCKNSTSAVYRQANDTRFNICWATNVASAVQQMLNSVSCDVECWNMPFNILKAFEHGVWLYSVHWTSCILLPLVERRQPTVFWVSCHGAWWKDPTWRPED